MGYYNFPHTRNYDTDLGYLIKQYLKLSDEVELLISSQTITYADPLEWDITTQYKVNTIVINGYNAYLSKQPVPKGILITNTDYWLTVGDFIQEFEDLRNNIADANNGVSPTLLATRKKDDLLWWNDTLYQCLTDIVAGTALIINTNIKQITIEDYVNNAITSERIARENADTVINNAITSETIARENADTTLQNAITSETNARENADIVINNKINNIKAAINIRNYLFIADSYGMRSTSKPTWTEILVEKYPNNSKQKSLSSIGFSTYTEEQPNFSFLGKLKEFYNELTETERNNVTDIVVCGGWNDARQYAQGLKTLENIQKDIMDFVDYANNNFPSAIPWIGFIGWQTCKNVQKEATYESLIKMQLIYNGTIYKNLHHLGGVSDVMKCAKNMDITGFHPNPTGSNILAFGINAALNGQFKYTDGYLMEASDFTFNTASGVSGTFANCKVAIDGTTARLTMVLTGVTIPTNVNVLGTFGNTILPCGSMQPAIINFTVMEDHTSYYAVLEDNNISVYGTSPGITNKSIIITATINTEYDR